MCATGSLYGDLLAWNVWEANILLRAEHAGWATIAGELGSLFRSFWGLFGWLNVPYPEPVYQFFAGADAARRRRAAAGRVAAAATAVAARRRLVVGRAAARLARSADRLVAALYARRARGAGSLLLPAAPTLIWLAAVGLTAWRIWTLGGLVAGSLALLSVITPPWLIAPAYTPPPVTDTIPAELTPVAGHVCGRHRASRRGRRTGDACSPARPRRSRWPGAPSPHRRTTIRSLFIW